MLVDPPTMTRLALSIATATATLSASTDPMLPTAIPKLPKVRSSVIPVGS